MPFLRGLYIPWDVALTCAGIIAAVTFAAAGFAFRNVMKLQPADVFRS